MKKARIDVSFSMHCPHCGNNVDLLEESGGIDVIVAWLKNEWIKETFYCVCGKEFTVDIEEIEY